MALSRVDIYNMALGAIKVGEVIDHVDDEAARRFLLPQNWDLTLSQLLSRHAWKFATVSRKLAKSAFTDDCGDEDDETPGRVREIAPAAVYGRTWAYPSDCHKMLSVGMVQRGEFDFATKYPWEVQSGHDYARIILTMHDHACAQYISNQVPEVFWPGAFTNAFVWAMASQIARAINATYTDAESCLKQAEEAFIVARSQDVEEQGRAIPRNGNLIESRSMYGDPPIGEEDLFSLANHGFGYWPISNRGAY